ncbi:hypothetical protein V865_006887 [Kwoniella europaea PYCC6329]|uniref:Uncharacterized protein n=1 Tax=Kwoniella europaea PYCC6329 TaxID=1423913 RepID=A0AAX4KRV8_9TREE
MSEVDSPLSSLSEIRTPLSDGETIHVAMSDNHAQLPSAPITPVTISSRRPRRSTVNPDPQYTESDYEGSGSENRKRRRRDSAGATNEDHHLGHGSQGDKAATTVNWGSLHTATSGALTNDETAGKSVVVTFKFRGERRDRFLKIVEKWGDNQGMAEREQQPDRDTRDALKDQAKSQGEVLRAAEIYINYMMYNDGRIPDCWPVETILLSHLPPPP